MTRKKTPASKLNEVITGEYDDHLDRWEALKAARYEQFLALHYTQSRAILEALRAWEGLETSFCELYSPSFEDICKAKSAMAGLRFHFNVDFDEDE